MAFQRSLLPRFGSVASSLLLIVMPYILAVIRVIWKWLRLRLTCCCMTTTAAQIFLQQREGLRNSDTKDIKLKLETHETLKPPDIERTHQNMFRVKRGSRCIKH